MKKLYLLAMWSLCISILYGVPATNDELRTMLDKIQPNFNSSITPIDLNYWPSVLTKFPELKKIADNATNYKSASLVILSEPQKIDKSEFSPWHHRSGLIIASMSGLPADEYLDFTKQIVERSEKKEILLPESDLANLLFPKLNNTGLFEYNFKDPVVRDMIERIKTLRLNATPISDTEYRSAIISTTDSMLSGEMRRSRERARKNYPNEYPNNILPPITAFQMAHDTARADTSPIPDRSTSPGLTPHSAFKPSPTITPEAKSQMQPSSNVALVVGIILLLAVAGFVFYRRQL